MGAGALETEMPEMKNKTKNAMPNEMKTVLFIAAIGFLAVGIFAPLQPLFLSGEGIDAQAIGLLTSSFMLAVFLSEFVWGWVVDATSPKVALFCGLILEGLAMLAYLYAQSLAAFFLVSIAYGFFWTPPLLVARWYMGVFAPPNSKSSSLGMITLVVAGANAAGGFLGGWLANSFGLRTPIIVSGLLLILTGILIIPLLTRLNFSKPEFGQQGAAIAAKKKSSQRIDLRRVFQLGMLSTLFFTAFQIMATYLPLLSESVFHSNPGQIGALFGVFGLGRFVLAIPVSRLADRFGRWRFVLIGLIGTALSFAGFAIAPNYFWVLISMVVFSVALVSLIPALSTLISQGASGAQQGRIMGFQGAFEDGGGVIGPAIGGLLWAGVGVRSPFIFAALVVALGAVYWASFGRKFKSGVHLVQGIEEQEGSA
jgi:MFS family permease